MKKIVLSIAISLTSPLIAMSQSIVMNRSKALTLLNLSGTPTAAEINSAYRKTAVLHHPDLKKTVDEKAVGEEAMKEITAARNYLQKAYAQEAQLNQPPTLYEIIKEMLDNGENVDVTDSFGCTPLIMAADTDSLLLADLLIGRQANVNAQTFYTKDSPLIIAAYLGIVPMLELLLRNKANVTLTDYKGQTALDFAFAGLQTRKATPSQSYATCIRLLKEAYKAGLTDGTYKPRRVLTQLKSSL